MICTPYSLNASWMLACRALSVTTRRCGWSTHTSTLYSTAKSPSAVWRTTGAGGRRTPGVRSAAITSSRPRIGDHQAAHHLVHDAGGSERDDQSDEYGDTFERVRLGTG